MTIVERVKNICLTPATEWAVIAEEPTSTSSLLSGYVVPLAAIGSIAGFIGGSIVGRSLPFIGYYRVPVMSGLALAIFTFCMAFVGVFILSLIINALAPTFGGEKNSTQALKVAVYSYTPAWVAGVFQLFPLLGVLALIGALYGLYLLYLGLPRLMKSPQDKAAGYTAVVVVCAIVLSIVVGTIGGSIAGAGLLGAGALSGGVTGSRQDADVQFDPNSPLGKLQQLGDKLEKSNAAIEAAGKTGDANAQAAAAMASLGTLLGGGSRVEPVAVDELKQFVPETFAGLQRTSSRSERNGIVGVSVATSEAVYGGSGDQRVTLEVSDTGGVSGLMGLASWAGVENEKEDDQGSERTQRVNGRLVHEKISKTGGRNEFSIVLGNRFVVTAKGDGVEFDTLKAGVSGLDLGKLEAMKDVGVQK